MRANHLLFLSLFVTVSCTAADKFEASTFFYEQEAQLALRHELTKANIPHRIDEKGAVWYRIQDTEKVASIKKKVVDEVLVNQFSTSYARREEEILFTDALKKNGIEYQIKEQSGHRWIVWSPEDDSKVKKIEDKVGDLILEKRAEEQRRAQQNR